MKKIFVAIKHTYDASKYENIISISKERLAFSLCSNKLKIFLSKATPRYSVGYKLETRNFIMKIHFAFLVETIFII